jgi:hypothetical protein
VRTSTREQFLHWNFALQRWWGVTLFRAAAWIFALRTGIEERGDVGRGPVIVFIRHASIADTLLAVVFLSIAVLVLELFAPQGHGRDDEPRAPQRCPPVGGVLDAKAVLARVLQIDSHVPLRVHHRSAELGVPGLPGLGGYPGARLRSSRMTSKN